MIVNVKYTREDGNPFGRAYSYRTKLPLGTGARVLCPTSSGMRRGVVTEYNVPESAVDPEMLPLLREITLMDRTTGKPVTVTAEADWDAAPTVEATVTKDEAPHPSADADTFPQGKAEERIDTAPAEAGADSGNAAPDVEGLVSVTQLPVIVERLRQMKDYVEGMTEEAVALACTEETVQTVKQRRADLNRFFKALEDKRKAVKAAVMGPYTAFEAVYKECICNPFNDADAKLKAKIDAVEGEQKKRCEDWLRKWFAELTLTHNVSWLTFEQTGVKIDMASAKAKTPQKLQDKLNEFAAKVALDQEAIANMDGGPEIMTEYKKCLNMAAAVKTVHERWDALEREKKEAEERKAALIEHFKAVKAAAKADAPEVLAPPVQTEEREILRSAQDDSKVYKCSFTVRATKDQLRALKKFMTQEGIRYE